MTPFGPGVFVTGTDTGVGKTVVCTGLLRLAARARLPLVPFKPVETGVTGHHPADASALLAAAALTNLPLSSVCPITFRQPVAPAAARRGPPLTATTLLAHARGARAHGEGLLVESAGGLLAPYAPRLTAADLAALLGLPLLLVARDALGTINHTALCLAEIRRRQLPLLGVLLVATAPPDRRTRDQRNAALIAAGTGVRPYGVPYLARPDDPDAVADALAALPPVRRLLAALRARRAPRASSER
jgi:dethiobiotin synthetase